MDNSKQYFIRYLKILLIIIFSGVTVYLQWYMTELSCKTSRTITEGVEVQYILIGLFAILVLDLILIAITNRFFAAVNITSILLFIYSVAGYFVYKFHGSPLTLGALKGAKTALDVFSLSYFSLDRRVILITGIFIILLILDYLVYKITKTEHRMSRKFSFIPAVLSILIFIPVFDKFGPYEYWRWDDSISIFGCVPTVIRASMIQMRPVLTPPDYNEEETTEFIEKYDKIVETGNNKPDIILILNETWYDMKNINAFNEEPYAFSVYDNADGGGVYKGENGFTIQCRPYEQQRVGGIIKQSSISFCK